MKWKVHSGGFKEEFYGTLRVSHRDSKGMTDQAATRKPTLVTARS